VTTWTRGRWVGVALPDGTSRHDWVPEEQSPSPDGKPGLWHIVGESGEQGRWEWHPALAAKAPPPARAGAANGRPPASGPSSTHYRPYRAIWLPSWLGTKRPLLISNRATVLGAVAAVAALAVLAFAVVAFTIGGSDEPGAPAASRATAPRSADLEFPKVSGPWTLYRVTVERDPATGNFTGRATVGYTGSDSSGASIRVVIDVFRGSGAVAQLAGKADRVKSGSYAEVDLTSKDDWVRQQDGFTFSAG